MQVIKKIYIENFRSINKAEITIGDIAIFIGKNDAGKSNVLKALNLFFNNRTGVNQLLDFKTDFCMFPTTKTNKAREIVIELEIAVPDRFKDHGDWIWRKVWRKEGLKYETILKKDTQESPKPNSRVGTYLNRINYRYVPAIRGSNYMSVLLGDLYENVFSSAGSSLASETERYSAKVSNLTKQISENIENKLNLNSVLSMPIDQTDIFKSLQFETHDSLNNSINLNNRGDGIQTRHIPSILKFMHDNDMKGSLAKAVANATIWGYEEPENSLEMSQCYEMANELIEYSSTVQILATTHSPAFYMLKNNNTTEVNYVYKSDIGDSVVESMEDCNKMHENMGLLQLISPFITDKIAELEELRKNNREVREKSIIRDINYILVEGITDELYLSKAIELHSPKLKEMIDNDKLSIFTSKERGGAVSVSSWCKGFMSFCSQKKIYAIFDNDKAGKNSRKKLIEELGSENGNIKTKLVSPSGEVIGLFAEGFQFENEIEHLIGASYFRGIPDNWLEPRTVEEKQYIVEKKMTADTTINEIIDNITNEDIKKYYVEHKIKDDKKKKLYDNFLELSKIESTIFKGFGSFLEEMEEYFMKN